MSFLSEQALKRHPFPAQAAECGIESLWVLEALEGATWEESAVGLSAHAASKVFSSGSGI